MTWASFQILWPILAVLVYVLVTSVLTVLAYMRKNEIDLHRRVFESLELRQAYTEAVRQRREMMEAKHR